MQLNNRDEGVILKNNNIEKLVIETKIGTYIKEINKISGGLSHRMYKVVTDKGIIYETLKRYYYEREHIKSIYPEIIAEFENWLKIYWNKERIDICKNKSIFDVDNKIELYQAIIYYISGMTDNYAIDIYNKIIKF